MNIEIFEKEMFDLLYELDSSFRKTNGATFTPIHTVKFMFEDLGIDNINPLDTTILEPSCGMGVYILYYLNFLLENEKINKNNCHIILSNIFATDLNHSFVDLTKDSIFKFLTFNKLITDNQLITNILNRNIYQSDFLFDPTPISSFDFIIGNPPYVRQHYIDKKYKIKLANEFRNIFTGMADLSLYFSFKAHSILSKNGVLSFITSNKFKTTKYGAKFRKEMFPFLSSISYENDVFEDVQIDTQVFKYLNQKSDFILLNKTKVTKTTNFGSSEWTDFKPTSLNGKTLKELGITITNGLVSGLNKSHVLNQEEYKELIVKLDKNNESSFKQYICKIANGKDINLKIGSFSHSKYIIFATNENCPFIKKSTILMNHFKQFKDKLENRSWFKTKSNIEFFQLQSESQVLSNSNTYFATKRIGGLKFVEIDSDVRYMDTLYQLIVPGGFDIKKVIKELDSDSVKEQFIKISNKIGSSYEVHKNKFERLVFSDKQVKNITK